MGFTVSLTLLGALRNRLMMSPFWS